MGPTPCVGTCDWRPADVDAPWPPATAPDVEDDTYRHTDNQPTASRPSLYRPQPTAIPACRPLPPRRSHLPLSPCSSAGAFALFAKRRASPRNGSRTSAAWTAPTSAPSNGGGRTPLSPPSFDWPPGWASMWPSSCTGWCHRSLGTHPEQEDISIAQLGMSADVSARSYAPVEARRRMRNTSRTIRSESRPTRTVDASVCATSTGTSVRVNS